jgi:preprotein translocase subunit SecA
MRHYDVQLMGGIVLHGGNIAEMVTGEGKTLVATLAAYLNALEGKGVHVVTGQRLPRPPRRRVDEPAVHRAGHDRRRHPVRHGLRERQQIYGCDITYGTNNEFGFDYLRDNMKPTREQQAQGPLNYAFIDEVDSILDRRGADAPDHLGAPAFDDVRKYAEADRIARLPQEGRALRGEGEGRTCHLNDDGHPRGRADRRIGELLHARHMEWPHLIDNASKAHHLYRRDREYSRQRRRDHHRRRVHRAGR